MKKSIIGVLVAMLVFPLFFVGVNSSTSNAQEKPEAFYIKPPAQAKQDEEKGKFKNKVSNPSEKRKRNKEIYKELSKMHEQGLKQKTINNRLKNQFGLIPWEKVEKNKNQSLSALFGTNTAEASESENVTVNKPTVYYDSREGDHIVFAKFEWNDSFYWENDLTMTDSTHDVGGKDGFAVQFDRHIQMQTYDFKLYDHDYDLMEKYTNPQTLSNYGVGFIQEDTYYANWDSNGGMYSWHHGEIYGTFDVTTYDQHAVRSELVHTWNEGTSVGVSSVKIQKDGIDFGLTTSTDKGNWNGYSEEQALYNP